MSPFLFSADHAHSDLGRRARAAITVAEATALSMAAVGETGTLSITDLFADYAAARARNDRARMAAIRFAADPGLLDELDGFDYPAAA